MPRRIILDTDPGIDDALAILLALASPEVELAGITVTGGNCTLDDGVRNALGVVALTPAPATPVHAGVALPLLRPPFTAPETHGDSGLGYARLDPAPQPPAAEHAVDMIIREILAHPGEITLVAVAPLTNLALAVRKQPRIAELVGEVIIMGGAVSVDGNTTHQAEFNFFVDPHAAQIVLSSGMPITLVPWDITSKVLLTGAQVAQLRLIDSPITRFVAEATRFYIEFHELCFGFSGCSLNDPVALALAFAPELARTVPMHIAVEHASELTAGRTVVGYAGSTALPPSAHDMLGWDTGRWPHGWSRVHRPAANAQVVVEFDSERFVAIFLERITQLARGTN
ncbi:MAG: nucleoside hydrolase [Roseiflexaceae bacterium]|nr:nucleoside hydrolase [Roseiflexaceae bacterium]